MAFLPTTRYALYVRPNKILVLTADPGSLGRLRVGEEVRQIVHRIWQTEHRDRFEVVSELSVRRSEVIELLNRHRPNIVHFSDMEEAEAIAEVIDCTVGTEKGISDLERTAQRRFVWFREWARRCYHAGGNANVS